MALGSIVGLACAGIVVHHQHRPTVPVTPGAGKSQAAFYADRRLCMATTDHAVQPVADRMNAAAETADQVQPNNEQIQRRYNDSFGRCVAARGNALAAPAIAQAAGPPTAPASPAVHDRSNSPALFDPQSQAAKRFIAPTVRELLAACRRYPAASNARRITFEYVMLKGVNDSEAEACELVRLISGIPAKVRRSRRREPRGCWLSPSRMAGPALGSQGRTTTWSP